MIWRYSNSQSPVNIPVKAVMFHEKHDFERSQILKISPSRKVTTCRRTPWAPPARLRRNKKRPIGEEPTGRGIKEHEVFDLQVCVSKRMAIDGPNWRHHQGRSGWGSDSVSSPASSLTLRINSSVMSFGSRNCSPA
jgi:hypothetical protein